MTAAAKPIKKRERRKLKDLVPFPTQDQVFSARSEAENDSLRENIRVRKLRELIHVLPENAAGLPPNTILSGHRRCRALMELGFREYDVLVRYDLADASMGELESIFMDENDQRRQLSQLESARIAVRRLEIELGKEPGDLTADERREAITRVQVATDLEERNARRYLHIVHAPLTIQNAFDRGEITITEASSLAVLPSALMEDADRALQSGKNAKEVAREFKVSRSKKIHRNAKPKYAHFIGCIKEVCGSLEKGEVLLSEEIIGNHDLQSIVKLCDHLTAIVQRLQPKPPIKKQWPGVRYVGHGRPKTA